MHSLSPPSTERGEQLFEVEACENCARNTRATPELHQDWAQALREKAFRTNLPQGQQLQEHPTNSEAEKGSHQDLGNG